MTVAYHQDCMEGMRGGGMLTHLSLFSGIYTIENQ